MKIPDNFWRNMDSSSIEAKMYKKYWFGDAKSKQEAEQYYNDRKTKEGDNNGNK